MAVLARSFALLLSLAPGMAFAADADPWLGCWKHVYDADHLAKHPAQEVSAIGVEVIPSGKESGGVYLARVEMRFRDKDGLYKNFDGTRCRELGVSLHCVAKDKSQANFWLEREGDDLRLRLTSAGEGVEIVPPSGAQGGVQILPQNPEYQLFVMQPAAQRDCGL
jgi:hypothetical protein